MQNPLRPLSRPVLGLALGLSFALALAGPAEAQRRGRTDRGVGVSIQGARGGVQLSVGNRGVQFNAGRRFGRQERCDNYRGSRHARTGRWEERCERVWVQGPTRRIWVPAVYETHYDSCGRSHQHLVRAGYWDTIQEQGCWETRTRRVWVPYRRAISAR